MADFLKSIFPIYKPKENGAFLTEDAVSFGLCAFFASIFIANDRPDAPRQRAANGQCQRGEWRKEQANTK